MLIPVDEVRKTGRLPASIPVKVIYAPGAPKGKKRMSKRRKGEGERGECGKVVDGEHKEVVEGDRGVIEGWEG